MIKKYISKAERREKREWREQREAGLSKYILSWWTGEAHSHSKESTREGYGYAEGIYDIEEMMEYYEGLGLEFAAFTEHSSKPGTPEKQSPDSSICQSLLREAKRITQINQARSGRLIALSGVETNIFFGEEGEPTIDIPSEVLRNLDIVIASRHAIVREKEPEAIKETLLFVAHHPDIDVIGHPDRYTRRDGEKSPQYWREYWEIWEEILQRIADNNKAFEINLNHPPSERLVQRAAELGVKFFINYDAHDFNQYQKVITDEIKIKKEKVESDKKRWEKRKASDEEIEILRWYKQDKLSSGPGVRAILRLVRWLKRLESYGVTKERVINSSKENVLKFLTNDRGKFTENLNNLTKRLHIFSNSCVAMD